ELGSTFIYGVRISFESFSGVLIAVIFTRLSLQCAGNRFILQNPHHYATILSFTFRALGVADLLAFSHRTRGQHSGEGNAALLNQDVGHGVGSVFAEFLVHGGTTAGRG